MKGIRLEERIQEVGQAKERQWRKGWKWRPFVMK